MNCTWNLAGLVQGNASELTPDQPSVTTSHIELLAGSRSCDIDFMIELWHVGCNLVALEKCPFLLRSATLFRACLHARLGVFRVVIASASRLMSHRASSLMQRIYTPNCAVRRHATCSYGCMDTTYSGAGSAVRAYEVT